MVSRFFRLEGPLSALDEAAFYQIISSGTGVVRESIYIAATLESKAKPRRWRVKDVNFKRVVFSYTEINDLEFTNCIFCECIFVATIFRNCRFNNCKFIRSNPYRIEFDNVYIDPRSFVTCLDKRKHQNIGAYLFQELLRNSRQQSQPDFADNAQYWFRKWQRYQLINTSKYLKLSNRKLYVNSINIIISLAFDITSGSGMRLSNLSATAITVLFVVSCINWCFAHSFGLIFREPISNSIVDAFYFSTITMTTLGFGDITPTTSLGRVIVSFEAIAGFILLGTFSSTLYRRISS